MMRKAALGVRAAAARWPRYGAAQLVGATPPTVPFRSTSGPLIVGVRQLSSTSSGGITITSTKGTKDAGGGDGGGGSGGGGGGGGDGVDMELEQRIADLQRQVRARFAEGSYHEARELAEHCKLDCVTHFGRAHPATASVINNIALCSKQLGEYEPAIDAYLEAVSLYEEAVGEHHPPRLSAMTNLGLCFQSAALAKGGLEKTALLDRAVETLEEALRLAQWMESATSGRPGNDAELVTVAARVHLAIARVHAAPIENRSGAAEHAIDVLEVHLQRLEERHPGKARGDMAMSWNNLGFVLKTAGQFDRAHEAYDRALEMREALLGPAHPDAIATKHNKAECMIAAGDELGAAELQRQILETLEVNADSGGGEVKEAERVVRTTNDVATFSNRPPKKK
mmetsp:Transcript_21856/g.50363  ORF Transcript_21856/g.50363 Transcript_21856/m.50363 type:complete len:397 (+) Transcript_21856:15-1205(+)